MGHSQAGLLDPLAAVDEQVEVDRARAEARPLTAHAPEAALDLE
jgi:hypothetical protein